MMAISTRMRSVMHYHHYFSTTTKQQQSHTPKHLHHRLAALAAAALVTAGASLYTRHLRDEKLSTLVLAKDSGILVSGSSSTSTKKSNISELSTSSSCSSPSSRQQKYNLPSLIETITRAGLIGSTKSVKDEVHVLRKWHIHRGYNGGVVVRDLSRPLFSLEEEDSNKNSFDDDDGDGDGVGGNIGDDIDINHTNRRECYYLYYEIHSNGETRQQLFCRGTTLLADVLTCLQTFFVYDEELGCHVHYGFNQHANRIVDDVLPLLVPPRSDDKVGNRATVEVCGHSLGGAVAMLVAIKLRKRGYFVTRVTSLAGPRFCRGIEERDILQKMLPKETIRIEDDLDVVTYLPPMGVSVGDKLWFAKDRAFMLPKDSLTGKNDWAESVWLNLRLFETISNQSKTHRVMSYVNKLEQLVKDMDND